MGKISIDDLAAVHNNKYTYCTDTHVTTKDKITIFCPIHGEFTQLVHNHKAGKGCIPGDFLLLTGNSELFTKDILELDNEQ